MTCQFCPATKDLTPVFGAMACPECACKLWNQDAVFKSRRVDRGKSVAHHKEKL